MSRPWIQIYKTNPVKAGSNYTLLKSDGNIDKTMIH